MSKHKHNPEVQEGGNMVQNSITQGTDGARRVGMNMLEIQTPVRQAGCRAPGSRAPSRHFRFGRRPVQGAETAGKKVGRRGQDRGRRHGAMVEMRRGSGSGIELTIASRIVEYW